jgi:four helix bundle protein
MVALKEMRESRFWLRLIARASIIEHGKYESALNEAGELCNILAKSVVTTKSAPARKP